MGNGPSHGLSRQAKTYLAWRAFGTEGIWHRGHLAWRAFGTEGIWQGGTMLPRKGFAQIYSNTTFTYIIIG